jgi:hypothetical protein
LLPGKHSLPAARANLALNVPIPQQSQRAKHVFAMNAAINLTGMTSFAGNAERPLKTPISNLLFKTKNYV